MKYYTVGCPDWRWCYKHNYPPLLDDLYKFIPSFDTQFLKVMSPQPVNPLVQLCYVLPRTSLFLMPPKLNNLLVTKYGHLYKSDCEFVWSYCRYFWESHVDLPEMDIDELESIVTLSTIS